MNRKKGIIIIKWVCAIKCIVIWPHLIIIWRGIRKIARDFLEFNKKNDFVYSTNSSKWRSFTEEKLVILEWVNDSRLLNKRYELIDKLNI